MVHCRRSYAPGGTFSFAVILRDRSTNHLVTYVDQLRASFRRARQKQPFDIIVVVILPDYLHAIFQLPEDDAGYPSRWRSIKSHFSRALVKQGVRLEKNDRGELDLWQRRYWEHQIRDEDDLKTHVDYIHFNPVKHGGVDKVADWPYSSFHRYVRHGVYDDSWRMTWIPLRCIQATY